MSSLNKCQFIGFVGADPEVKTLEAGVMVANLRIACGESYTNKAGEKVESTEWISLVAWGKLAEIIQKYVKKGMQIYAEGKYTTRSYEGQDGVKKYITEVIISEMKMLGKKEGGFDSLPHSATPSQPEVPPESNNGNTEDDLPF